MLDKKEPPCGTCRPVIMPGNDEAVSVYLRCSDQWLIAPSGLRMGLPAPAVEIVMRLMRVADRLECFDRVKLIAATMSDLWAEQAEKEQGQ